MESGTVNLTATRRIGRESSERTSARSLQVAHRYGYSQSDEGASNAQRGESFCHEGRRSSRPRCLALHSARVELSQPLPKALRASCGTPRGEIEGLSPNPQEPHPLDLLPDGEHERIVAAFFRDLQSPPLQQEPGETSFPPRSMHHPTMPTRRWTLGAATLRALLTTASPPVVLHLNAGSDSCQEAI